MIPEDLHNRGDSLLLDLKHHCSSPLEVVPQVADLTSLANEEEQ